MPMLKEAALIAALLNQTGVDLPGDEVRCMARNIYHEARSESIDGQLAVAHVTLNRVEHDRFPDSICDVVWQDKGPKAWDCQFSWTCDGKADRPRDMEAYALSVLLAIEVMRGAAEDLTDGSTYYLTVRDRYPGWVYRLETVGQIGAHLFLRERENV